MESLKTWKADYERSLYFIEVESGGCPVHTLYLK
jgi:hypothetical protein